MAIPRFGVIYSRLHEVIPPRQFAGDVETMGFNAVWATEGLANQVAALDPILVMGELAHGSERIRVGSCVILSPLRNPAVLAKEVATLDFFSSGRITLGIAVGGSSLSNPADYAVSGIDLKERAQRCNEGIEVMRRLWTGEVVSHEGEFFNFSGIYMHPCSVQTPHPPVWIGGNAEGAIKRAANYGDGFVPIGAGANDYRSMWQRLIGFADDAQRDIDDVTPAVHLFYCMADTRDEARQVVERTLTERYGIDVNVEDDQRYLLGNADDCSKVIEQYLDAGVTEFVINTVRPPNDVCADIEKFAEQVLPRFYA